MNIDTIIKDINNFNTSNPEDAKNKLISKKEYRGNQHELDSYISTMKYLEYKKNIRKNIQQSKVVSNENTFSDESSIQAHFETTQYKKKWSRLDSYLKLKKIEEYVKNLITTNRIKECDYKRFIALLKIKLNNKQLNKKNEISYDETNGIILDIPLMSKLLSD